MSLPTYDQLWEMYEQQKELADDRMTEILSLTSDNMHLQSIQGGSGSQSTALVVSPSTRVEPHAAYVSAERYEHLAHIASLENRIAHLETGADVSEFSLHAAQFSQSTEREKMLAKDNREQQQQLRSVQVENEALKEEIKQLKARTASSQPTHTGIHGNQVLAGTNVMANNLVVNYNNYIPPASTGAATGAASTQPQPQAPTSLAVRTHNRPPPPPPPPQFNYPCWRPRCNRKACKYVHEDQRELYKDLIPTLPRGGTRA